MGDGEQMSTFWWEACVEAGMFKKRKNNVNPCGTCAKVAKDNDSLLEFDALPIKVKTKHFQ